MGYIELEVFQFSSRVSWFEMSLGLCRAEKASQENYSSNRRKIEKKTKRLGYLFVLFASF